MPLSKTVNTIHRLLLYESCAMVRFSFRCAIEQHFQVDEYLEPDDTNQVLALIAQKPPALAIIDLDHYQNQEVNLIKQSKSQDASFPILSISYSSDLDVMEKGMQAGADGFLSKSQSHDTLIHAIQVLLQGGSFWCRRYLAKSKPELLPFPSYIPDHPLFSLSERERQIFQLIGIKMKTSKIATHLKVSTKTIESHRENLKYKLGFLNATELTANAISWVENGALL
ncbi:response regulator transcription factor [Kiritimatiellota bacterium B12222]|nr:response regulator transcription factor [Kiritimatiellota bacterium B12222]